MAKTDTKQKPERDALGRVVKGAKLNPKGRGATPNQVTQDIREMIHTALHKAGGVDYLVDQAINNPKSFLPLLAKIVPQEHKVTTELGEQLVEMLQSRRAQLDELRGTTIDVTPAE